MHRLTVDRPDTVCVTWELTTVCNYACWYCHEDFHNGRYRWPDLDASIGFFGKLCARKQHVVLDIQGGEPSLWPRLQDFVDAKPSNLEIELSSNGSRSVEWWQRNYRKLDNLVLSFHAGADLEHFKQVLSVVADGTVNVHVWILGDADFHDTSRQLLEFIKTSGLFLSCKLKVIDSRAGNELASRVSANKSRLSLDEFQQFHHRNTKQRPSTKAGRLYIDGQEMDMVDIMYNELYKFQGWTCNAGVTRLYIRGNGDIYRASCGNDPKLGSLLDHDGMFDIKPTICTQLSCTCTDDIKVEKWISEATSV
jgi:hypothetical protein